MKYPLKSFESNLKQIIDGLQLKKCFIGAY